VKLRGLRWWIVALLFGASVLNYVDRNSLSLLAPTIQQQLGFDDQAYARIQNAFQIAYTVALLASGFMVDRFGARFSLALFVAWWSLASFLTGFANSVFMLGACWFMLGLGEAGNWTASPKAAQEWFPARERGLAMGIYTAGTPLGMTLAPILVVGLAGASGWPTVFWTMGILGILWVIPWSWLYRPIKTHPLLGESERNWIQSDATGATSIPTKTAAWTWLEALGRKEVWFLLLGRMFSDPVWFFYLNWVSQIPREPARVNAGAGEDHLGDVSRGGHRQPRRRLVCGPVNPARFWCRTRATFHHAGVCGSHAAVAVRYRRADDGNGADAGLSNRVRASRLAREHQRPGGGRGPRAVSWKSIWPSCGWQFGGRDCDERTGGKYFETRFLQSMVRHRGVSAHRCLAVPLAFAAKENRRRQRLRPTTQNMKTPCQMLQTVAVITATCGVLSNSPMKGNL